MVLHAVLLVLDNLDERPPGKRPGFQLLGARLGRESDVTVEREHAARHAASSCARGGRAGMPRRWQGRP